MIRSGWVHIIELRARQEHGHLPEIDRQAAMQDVIFEALAGK
jgi:hypothetical protein